MEYKTIAGNYYTITSKSGCSVTDATGTLSMTVDAGGQLTVQAPSDKLVYDDEQAIVFKANFKSALAALGLLGGGDKLPAGYTRLEFLESTGTQCISVARSLTVAADCRFSLKAQNKGTDWQHAFGARVAANSKEFGVTYKVAADSVQVGLGGGIVSIPCAVTEVVEIEADGAKGTVVCGSASRSITLGQISMSSVGVFQRTGVPTYFSGRIFRASIFNAGQQFLQLVPALDPNGIPCLYDMVTRKPFYNSGSGSFIVGFTLSQAAQLGRKLPSTGGNLTISLPEGYDSNEAVINSLTEAESKGWVLTIQTYAAETAAATYSLRRVWVRRQQDENGSYVAADGSRWLVEWCVDVIGADPESLGYERFRSVDAAAEYWGLVPYEYPADELSTIEA